MTVSSTLNRKEYLGDGSSVAFTTPQFLDNSHITIYVDGVLQTLTTDYSLSGAGAASGTATFVSPPDDESEVVILNDPPITQETDWVENDSDPAAVKETAFDKLTLISQRLNDKIGRSIQAPDSDVSPDLELPAAASRASKYPVFDANGDLTVSAGTGADSGLREDLASTDSGKGSDLVANTIRVVNVKYYGAAGDDVTDDSSAISDACDAASGNILFFPAGTYLIGSAMALTSAHNDIKFHGPNATIKKGFNGDLLTLTNVHGFETWGITWNGDNTNYTGKGIVVTGSNSDYHYYGGLFTAFEDSYFEVNPDACQQSVWQCNFYPGPGQSSYTAIDFNGPDNSVMQRRLIGVAAPLGDVILTGANNTTFMAGAYGSISIDDDCQVTCVVCASAHLGTISGSATSIVGCRVSGDTVIDSDFTGSFIGNTQTSGTFTNNSVSAVVLHNDPSVGLTQSLLGNNKLRMYASGAERIQTSRVASVGDNDVTATVGSSAPVILYGSALTTNRTVTLSTTGAINGDRFRVVRTGGDTGGPWTVSVGGLKSLSQNTWSDVEYTGSSWILTGYGSL